MIPEPLYVVAAVSNATERMYTTSAYADFGLVLRKCDEYQTSKAQSGVFFAPGTFQYEYDMTVLANSVVDDVREFLGISTAAA